MPDLQRHATKAELVRIRQELVLAREGLGLLERKRDSLMNQALEELQQARGLRQQLTERWKQLADLWNDAYRHEDVPQLRRLAQDRVFSPVVQEGGRGWMSVNLAAHTYERETLPFLGAVMDCSLRPEQVRGMLHALMPELIDLLNRESNVRRLTRALRQCQRQVNALEEIVIPELREAWRRIEQRLEERERESLFQIKRLKGRLA